MNKKYTLSLLPRRITRPRTAAVMVPTLPFGNTVLNGWRMPAVSLSRTLSDLGTGNGVGAVGFGGLERWEGSWEPQELPGKGVAQGAE